MNETATYNPAISQLIEPEPISYSFNTPGWYMVFVLLILAGLIIAILQYRKYRKNAYRRSGIKEIENIIQNKKEVAAFEINQLLKKMAIPLFGREKVAALYGADWFNFLILTTNKTTTLPTNHIQKFTLALYNSTYQLTETQMNELKEFAVLWVKNHRVNV